MCGIIVSRPAINGMSARDRTPHLLTKRERQIMDVLYRLGRATAAEIMAEVPGAPGNSTIRTQLQSMREKVGVSNIDKLLLTAARVPPVPSCH